MLGLHINSTCNLIKTFPF